ncbi:MAG: SDR family oxidoreductase [Candidatus Melainabacteria bacterium]|nr:SDR family oxidoreductase [Candidatus Melainabacteria bacterium]
MNLGILNKVALIGGGSKGLGKGCAFQLAKEGVQVAICARNAETLKQTALSIEKSTDVKVLPIQADLSKTEDIRRVVQETLDTFGRIDILIANSGGPPTGDFFKFSEKDWENAYRSVLYYVIELYKQVIPQMRQQKWGRIINITSLAVKEPADNLILSNVFRSGVVSLAKTLSRELIQYNITINNLCPGAFKTERAYQLMADKAQATGEILEKIEEKAVKGLPLKRFQSPEELGDMVAFLASELAKGITGTTIQIDGGISKSLF